MLRLFVLALGAFSLGSAQTSCQCRSNAGSGCSTIQEGPLVGGALTCTTQAVTCSGCVCDDLGTLLCQVDSRTHLEFNGTASFCEIVTKPVAFCPGDFPGRNVTTCCINFGTGAAPSESCVMETFASQGESGTVDKIYRFVDAVYNTSGSFTNSGPTAVTFNAAVGIRASYVDSFVPNGLPEDLYFNITSQQTTTPTSVASGETFNFAFSLFDSVAEGEYDGTSAEATQLLGLAGATFDFPFAVTVIQVFPSGTSQITSWAALHCLSYELLV